MGRNILKEFHFKRVENIDPERKSLKELKKYKLNTPKRKTEIHSRGHVPKSFGLFYLI